MEPSNWLIQRTHQNNARFAEVSSRCRFHKGHTDVLTVGRLWGGITTPQSTSKTDMYGRAARNQRLWRWSRDHRGSRKPHPKRRKAPAQDASLFGAGRKSPPPEKPGTSASPRVEDAHLESVNGQAVYEAYIEKLEEKECEQSGATTMIET